MNRLFGRNQNQTRVEPSSSTRDTDRNTGRNPARVRHSLATPSFRNPKGTFQPNLPSSRSHAQLPTNFQQNTNQNFISQRSISASYISRAPSQQQRFGRQNDPYGARGRPLAPVASTPQKPKRFIERCTTEIKHRLDFSSYLDWPFDTLMGWRESLDLIDFDEYGFQFGFAFALLHLFFKICASIGQAYSQPPRAVPQSQPSTAGARLNHVRQHSRSSFSLSSIPFFWLCSVAMCIYSSFNAYKLFSARRAYQMHHREDMVNSPNAILVQSPTAPQEAPPTWGQTLLGLVKRLSTALVGWPSPTLDQIPKPTQVYQLNVWDIDPVKLRIYTLYPPSLAFIIHCSSLSENFLHWVMCMAATIVQVYWIVKSYSELVKDKAIIQAEVMNEYNTKFVYPKAFPHTREASTMTSSAEFIRREDWMSF